MQTTDTTQPGNSAFMISKYSESKGTVKTKPNAHLRGAPLCRGTQ